MENHSGKSDRAWVEVVNKQDRNWLLACVSQHAPEAARAGLLIGNGLAGKETLLPGHDIVGGMGSGRPVDAGLDVAERMARRQRRILLLRIDQRFDFVDARRAPPLPATHGFRGATGERTIPYIEDVIRFPFRSEEHTSELQSPKDLVCHLLLE